MDGLYVRIRSDGKLFNLAGLKSCAKTRAACIRELPFTNDSAFVSHSQEELQSILDRFSKSAAAFGLTINIKKTEVMYQPPPDTQYVEPNILLSATPLNLVDKFTYLGSMVSNDNSLDVELNRRIQAACSTFGRLNERVWKQHGIRVRTKCKVYRALVLSALLYPSESSTLYRRHIRRLTSAQLRHWRTILGISWQDHVSNVEVLDMAGLPSVEDILTDVPTSLVWTCRSYE